MLPESHHERQTSHFLLKSLLMAHFMAHRNEERGIIDFEHCKNLMVGEKEIIETVVKQK